MTARSDLHPSTNERIERIDLGPSRGGGSLLSFDLFCFCEPKTRPTPGGTNVMEAAGPAGDDRGKGTGGRLTGGVARLEGCSRTAR